MISPSWSNSPQHSCKMNTNPQDDPYGEHLPMNVMWRGDPAGIQINEPAVSSDEVTSLTRPRLSDSAPVRGGNWPFNVGNTPAMRFTGDTAQMSGMSVGSSYYGRIEMSAPPNRDPGHTMSIPSCHQSWSSPRFPSIHQAQSLISMQSSDPAKLSPHTCSVDRFEHTMGASSSYPNQPTGFIESPYHSRFQPSVDASSAVQEVHSTGSTCIYESVPKVDISRGAYGDSEAPAIPETHTASHNQVQPTFAASAFDGHEHTSSVSSSFPDQLTVFNQSPYQAHVQPSIGVPSPVQAEHSPGASCIYKSATSISGVSGELREYSPRSISTIANATTLHESSAAFHESSKLFCRLQSHHHQYPTVQTTKTTTPPESISSSYQLNELQSSESSFDDNTRGMGITLMKNSMKHCPINSEETEKLECRECQKKFSCQSKLKTYSIIHTDEKPFECNECGRKYRYEGSLKRHWDRMHCSWKPYVREKCGQQFRYDYILETHCNRVHPGGVRFFTCSICGRKVRSKKGLERHYKTVHFDITTFECSICGQKLSCKRSLHRHYNSVHLDIKPFECLGCGQMFDRKDNLKAHYNNVHLALKPFKCETCARSFSTKHGLKKHSCNEAI